MENRNGQTVYPVRDGTFSWARDTGEVKIEIDGMKVVVEKKVPLIQVEITEKSNGKPGPKPA